MSNYRDDNHGEMTARFLYLLFILVSWFVLKVELKVVPIKDIKQLNISFPIPDVNQYYESKVSFLIHFANDCVTLTRSDLNKVPVRCPKCEC